MKASELRIGNYIERKVSKNIWDEFTVRPIDIYRIYECTSWLIEHRPIQLTEEWLLKFGFALTQIGGYLNVTSSENTLYIFINESECGIAIENRNADADELEELSFVIKIKYVHQLQNLYFALTNEELTYEQQK